MSGEPHARKPHPDLAWPNAVEQITQLKARYFYHVDLQNRVTWQDEIRAPDAELNVPEFREARFVGPAEIASCREAGSFGDRGS